MNVCRVCRVCAGNPFAFWSQPSEQQGRRLPAQLQQRSEDEIRKCVQEWKPYVHPRAQDVFPTPDMIEEVLVQLAQFTDKNHDPLLGDVETCVVWHGEVTGDSRHAAIMTPKANEEPQATYANRVIAFLFASDESFDELMKLPKKGFAMTCGNNRCVTLHHIQTF
mmetsp:Transcript_8462/g.15979  ORF Transcript_8462/g.15979 Transcript_8462/m.15979 type:complete len:165 (+) Transcript_8462:877-1371(+)